MYNLPEFFGSMVFSERVMRERLPKDTCKALKRTIELGIELELGVANIVANAMKDWAIEKGVTHYTHWFQPLTGVTAEKHDSFIAPAAGGEVIMEFSGKELIRGEPDASSLPSGGIRATFEARGYTAWDPTSYAFIKDNVLCIPTAFCSYGGEALDMKTPLLRSMEAINKQAMRIMKLFGTDCRRVIATLGAEQEYFLVDREVYNMRKDLIYSGRTLFGALPPKGQEMDDHYFGSIRIRISAFMKELNEELWKLGILAKTEHNESAPAQHELAPVFQSANVATDHNQLTMELMRKVAKRHNLTCLLHEKPFEGINGSGKHCNWSLSTDRGVNLLEPGETPEENAQFLLILCAVLKAVDEYQDLLRISVASAGNDLRLGAHEAPPAIISMFIGEELEAILDSIEKGIQYDKIVCQPMKIGVDALPAIPRDTSDRNRTSPFAFTGNKFEFRMPGSSQSVSGSVTVINTIVADTLKGFADRLSCASDFTTSLNELIRETMVDHRRIIFNGNGYDKSWELEALKRGLSNYRCTADALPHSLDEKNIRLFERHGVYSPKETASRCDIQLGIYCKKLRIEARVMLEMARRDIIPAVMSFMRDVAETINAKHTAVVGISCKSETELLTRLSELSDCLHERCRALDCAVNHELAGSALLEVRTRHFHDTVLAAMQELRSTADELETIISKDIWPYPSYGHILYRI